MDTALRLLGQRFGGQARWYYEKLRSRLVACRCLSRRLARARHQGLREGQLRGLVLERDALLRDLRGLMGT